MDENNDDVNENGNDEEVEFPALQPGQTYAAKLTITMVGFDDPEQANKFCEATTEAVARAAMAVGILVVQSQAGLGIAMKASDFMKKDSPGKVDGINIPGLDLTKYNKN